MRDIVRVGDVLHLFADLCVHDQHHILAVVPLVAQCPRVKHIVCVHFYPDTMLVAVLADLLVHRLLLTFDLFRDCS